jgi:hypothetical protein
MDRVQALRVQDRRWGWGGNGGLLRWHYGVRLRGWRRLGEGPEVHRDSPVGFNYSLPDLGQDYPTIRSYQVIVALENVWDNDLEVKESLVDEFLHSLSQLSVNQQYTRRAHSKKQEYQPPTSYIGGTGS